MNRINVTRSSMPSIEEYIQEIEDIWDTHWLTNMGEKHNSFQEMLQKYLQVDNIELLVNGHMSLEMTLQAFDFPKGSEVITTPFTFASTTHAIVRNGLVPVFCDINKDDYLLDYTKVEELITAKTVAILPVHVYGSVCNADAIQSIAKQHGLKVIYDAAHAFGETWNGISVGMLGDAACFSFHATKVFNTIEGGASCFRDENIGKKIYDLKNFGIHGPNDVEGVGANAKMNEFCAAMGICNLRHVDEEIAKRERVYNTYTELLGGVAGLKTLSIQKNVKPNYSYYPILIDEKQFGKNRDKVYEDLVERNIYTRKYFYPLTSDFSCYRSTYDSNSTPVAKWVSERILTLPMYADLAQNDIERISGIVLK